MRSSFSKLLLAGLFASSFAACADQATQTVEAGSGPHPVLPPPQHSLLPTEKIAPAKGWAAGAKPTAAPGLAVSAYAGGLDHPRGLYVLPNGDVLVAETNSPAKPDDDAGIKGPGPRIIALVFVRTVVLPLVIFLLRLLKQDRLSIFRSSGKLLQNIGFTNTDVPVARCLKAIFLKA